MRFDVAIDQYVADMQTQGRMNSAATERDYRLVLYRHADDVDNRDPRYTGREDVKRTLRRWPHPNSQRHHRRRRPPRRRASRRQTGDRFGGRLAPPPACCDR
ncbi:MAG: hypothetical protein JST53_01630 [Actinobacteria bacterium]|nr:hypothetical protein [Actinomycetota bacterium]